MIGSFWNLCRACPSMPVDKLHSEYRSTYRWHEYTGPRQEVVRRPPQPAATGGGNSSSAAPANAAPPPEEETAAAGAHNNNGSVLSAWEPHMPRKKKHPELAYRAHEFIMSEGSDDSLDSTVGFDRARSEERTGRRMRPSRRSKSEGPPTRYGGGTDFGPFQSEYRLQYSKIMAARQQQQHTDQDEPDTMTSSFPPPFRPASTRISTEYRLQFAWPRPPAKETAAAGSTPLQPPHQQTQQPPRKSLSMGALRAQAAHAPPAPVHHHRTRRQDENDAAATELEPLVGADVVDAGGEEKILEETCDKIKKRKEFKTEYKKRFRPFSQYEYVDGRFNKRKPEVADLVAIEQPPPTPLEHHITADLTPSDPWYTEVIELRKKAGQYKHRGWGTELVPEHLAELYGKQVILWEQVSRRSSLSALSLASSTPRSITKEEKEKENSKKTSPSKGLVKLPGRVDRVDGVPRSKADRSADREPVRSRKEFLIRHHLERTTGAEDGALLVSPTREKLEPVVPRRKEEDSSNKSPSKGSPKSSPRSARSQSVGPSVSENRSPKRQPRTPGSASTTASAAAPKQNGPTERRPRPMVGGAEAETSPLLKRAVFQAFCNSAPSLNTSSATRSKSSSVAMRNSSEDKTLSKNAKAAAQSGAAKAKKADAPRTSKPPPVPQAKKADDKISGDTTDAGPAVTMPPQQELPSVHTQKATPVSASASDTKEAAAPEELLSPDTNNTVSLLDDEPLIKSPPEPTRVKSPEQIIMRSPEPVNWTVPLDTGKTFTVTQNVREAVPQVNKAARGELSRPHGESSRHWGAPASSLETSFDKVELPQEIGVADEGSACVVVNGDAGADSPDPSEATPPTLKSAAAAPAAATTATAAAVKPVAGTTLKCLDDPDFDPQPSPAAPSAAPSTAPARPYTVLEAPPPTAAAPTAAAVPRPSGYRILEAPDPADAPTARSVASDVLEKARNRFDMFWGKDGKL